MNLLTPPDYFFTSNAVLFALAVLLPTGLSAAQEAYECAGERPQVHEGFFKLYRGAEATGKDKRDPKLHKSVRRVVHETVREFLEKYPDTETISITGHSLGAAIAVLSAYDLVASETNVGPKNGKTYPVACFSFEGPRVGNPAFVNSFRDFKAKGLACVRIANKPDIVTEVPKAFYLQNVYYILAAITNNGLVVDIIDAVERLGYWLQLPSAWQHVAQEQSLVHDSREVDYLKKMPGWLPWENSPAIGHYHNLEVNLHLVSGYWGGPDAVFDRDFALCNKSADIIDERAGVQPNWFSGKVKGLVPSRAEPGALIEPYADWLEPPSGDDEERKRGEGPAVGPGKKECKPLVRNYFKKYGVIDHQ